jgi:hypothetical protein
MEKQQTMNEQESLAVIREMIDRTRTNFKDQSFYYLLWGWLVVGSLIVEAILFNQGSIYHWLVWPVMGTVGGIISGVYGRKRGKQAGYNTHMDRIMTFVWVGFVLYLVVVILNAPKYGWNTAFMLIAGLYGLGTFISGGLLNFKPLVYGGIASFVLVAIATFIPSIGTEFNQAMILLAASITVSYLIPGYALKRS